MIKYIEATKRPYGYLFIDLKQSTPEEDRIKTDIFENIPGRESVHCKLTLESYKNTSMVSGGMDEHINRHTPKYGQSEDKPQSEQTLRSIIPTRENAFL